MSNISSSTPPASHGTTLALFMGSSKEQQIDGLQSVKDALSDVFMACLNNDCMLKTETPVQLQAIYLYADSQIKALKKSKLQD